MAEKLDEQKYDFKPVKEEMSFKEQLVHIGENIYWLSSTYIKMESNPYSAISTKFTTKTRSLFLGVEAEFQKLRETLKNLNKTAHTYSYRFKGSFAETKYGKEIAKVAGWSFEDLEIPPSYMWDSIDESARINKCYAEFTHARQIAVAEALSKKGDV